MKKFIIMPLLSIMLLTGCTGEQQSVDSIAEAKVQNELKGYLYETNGTKIGTDMEAAPIIEALGEALGYFEAASCAFDGLDKVYTYGSYEISTYPLDGTDYIASVILKDDIATTAEGISLSMKVDDMIAAYGKDYEIKNGNYVYTKEDMQLRFVVEDDEIISIEYISLKIP